MQVWCLLQQIVVQTVAVYCMPVFWFAVLLLMIQTRIQKKQRTHGQTANQLSVFLSEGVSALWVIVLTVLAGWLGGIVASALLLCMGVCLDSNVLLWLWGVMIPLVLIQRRFVCFAYAGGMVALVQCWLYQEFSIGRQVLMLVAVLHFTEAVLVRISGNLQSMPVYLRDGQGRTTMGTKLQMTWPIPLAMPMLFVEETPSASIQSGYYAMPDWWPLLAAIEPSDWVMLYQLVPMFAAIGYHDLTERPVSVRMRTVSCYLMIYSVLLSVLVFLSCKMPALLYVAAAFSVLGHEIIAKQ